MKPLGIATMALASAWTVHVEAASALVTIGPRLARDIGSVPAGAMVVAAPVSSDVAAPRGDELAVRLATLLSGKIRATTYRQAASLQVARVIAAKSNGLIFLQIEIAHGELRVTADLYPVAPNGWDRLRAPVPAPSAHAFASAPIDAEVRTFLAPIVLEQAHVSKATHDRGDVLAAACGDIDGDGGMDLALVSRTTVAWGHLRAGRFVAVYEAPWNALAPRAPVPFREPLATAVIAARNSESDSTISIGGNLYAGLTDRGGVVLSRDLRGAAALPGLPVAAPLAARSGVLCVRPDPAVLAFEAPAKPCSGPPAAIAPEAPAPRYDALAAFELVGTRGASRTAVGAREPSGTLHIRLDSASDASPGSKPRSPEEIIVKSSGAQIALGDLDQDGALEIVTTAETGEDAIIISTWRADELQERLRLLAPPGVRALAVCPPEERGSPALVAIVGAEVWVVR